MRDRRTLAVLVLQAPLIGLLIALVFHSGALATGASPIAAVAGPKTTLGWGLRHDDFCSD